jgi:hypothetical protein
MFEQEVNMNSGARRYNDGRSYAIDRFSTVNSWL